MTHTPHIAVLEARGHWGIKKGLDNIRTLLEALGRPEATFPAVLLAGTNGKGSTGAFLAHALRAADHRIGWTTSPHLRHPRERVWIDGGPITEDTLDRLLGEVVAAETRLGLQATYFELMIAAAMLAFREARIDLALVEVGMGGRWDSTNALDPVLTVLTNIALDHTAFLGDTREAIGREKLCTARNERPLVLGPGLDPAWVASLLECAPSVHPAPELALEALRWDHSRAGGYRLGLAGRHQVQNASTARETLRLLRGLGWKASEEAIAEGFASARWPGRLWKVPGFADAWMDGAHNPDGARALADHAVASGTHPHLLFGAMGDKDLAGVVAELRRIEPASVTLVKGTDPRYATAEALQAAWGAPFEVLDPAGAAAWMAGEGTRLVTGSLYLIGDLLRALGLDPWA